MKDTSGLSELKRTVKASEQDEAGKKHVD